MQRGNVLVIGNSGVGKSTLINAILGETMAKTGWGTEGTTEAISLYENKDIPFRLIDTAGFEPSFFKQNKVIKSVKRWSEKSAKEGHADNQINLIWFCVDGTSRKLFPQTIKSLSKSISMWKSVPIIAVITKSYSIPEREENIQMVYKAFGKHKLSSTNLNIVIPVVASTYVLNESAYAAPDGIADLIEATNNLMPEGIKASKIDVANFTLKRKRALSHGVVGLSTTSAAVVGAVPIPFSDTMILAQIEIALINSLAHVYDIKKDEQYKKAANYMVEVGVISLAAKTAVNALKAIPGINLGASIINSIVAGSIVAAIGEVCIYIFEEVYLGKRSVSDIDWIKKVMESNFSTKFPDLVKAIAERVTEDTEEKNIGKIVSDVFINNFKILRN